MFLQDLNRQVVKSDAASFTIPELEFESPAFSQKGGKVLPLPFFSLWWGVVQCKPQCEPQHISVCYRSKLNSGLYFNIG